MLWPVPHPQSRMRSGPRSCAATPCCTGTPSKNNAPPSKGSTTRRPRRVGWIDLVMLRASVRVNGLTGLAVTKLDVLGGLDRIKACISYRHEGRSVREFPASMKVLSACEPAYKDLRGWPEIPEEEWIGIAKKGQKGLPDPVRKYLAFLESALKVPVKIASVGRSRSATMRLAR